MARGSISLPQVTLTPPKRGFLETKRKDTWWLFPTITLIYFLSFIVYSTWAAFQGAHYWYEGPADAVYGSQYLSPMYSPVIWSDPAQPGSAPVDHAVLGAWPDWLPKLLFGFL